LEVVSIPERKAAYKRGWNAPASRGHAPTVECGFCGRMVPKYKCFVTYRGFRITDPGLRREIDSRFVAATTHKIYVCPQCARFHGIVQKKKR